MGGTSLISSTCISSVADPVNGVKALSVAITVKLNSSFSSLSI